MSSFWRKKIVQPLLELLKTGLTPEKMSLSIACGVVFGIFPALGTTTVLCAVAAFVLRLNLPAIQIVNYVVYPLQIFLLLPFYRAGELLFDASQLPLSFTKINAMMQADFWTSIKLLWSTTWHAIVVWAVVAPVIVFLVYWILLPALRRMPLSVPARDK